MGGRGSTRWGHRGDYVPPLRISEATVIRVSWLFRELHPQEGTALVGRIPSSSATPVDFTIDAKSLPATVFFRFSEAIRAAGMTLPADTNLWLHGHS